MTESVRLAKRLAEMAPCSRRDAELYIAGGWVSVDGVVVVEPESRVSTHTVVLHPEATLAPIELVTILFHQAVGGTAPQISLENHVGDDSADIRPLKRHFSRLVQTAPLEPAASGLAILTQDWRIVRKFADTRGGIEHEYNVEVAGDIAPHGLKQLCHGLRYNGRPLPPAKVSWQSETRLRFAIDAVQPGQLAHMCGNVGLTVVAIKRIRIGKISMAKLPLGQWRYHPRAVG